MRRLRRHAPRLLAGIGLALGVAACSGPTTPEAGLPAPVGPYAHVRVQVTRGAGADHADVLVSSRFIGYRGLDRTTADLLTGADAAIAMGCGPVPAPAPYEDLLALLPDASQGKVEHLDAGEITVVVDGVALASGTRSRPPLAPYVTGMEYTDQAASLLVPRGDVLLTGLGGARVGAFEVGATVPPPIDAHATWAADLAVAWSPARVTGSDGVAFAATPSAADEVVLTIAPQHGAGAIVCRATDRGEVHVRADLLARVAAVAPGDLVTVVIDRVRRVGFAAPGLADASLEVVARDVVTASAQ